MIAQSEFLKTDLKQREDAAALEKSDHIKAISAFDDRVKSVTEAINLRSAELDYIASQQVETDKNQTEERLKLDNIATQIKLDQDARDAALNFREQAIKEGEFANSEEAKRISDWEAKLKAKAARLAAEASS